MQTTPLQPTIRVCKEMACTVSFEEDVKDSLQTPQNRVVSLISLICARRYHMFPKQNLKQRDGSL